MIPRLIVPAKEEESHSQLIEDSARHAYWQVRQDSFKQVADGRKRVSNLVVALLIEKYKHGISPGSHRIDVKFTEMLSAYLVRLLEPLSSSNIVLMLQLDDSVSVVYIGQFYLPISRLRVAISLCVCSKVECFSHRPCFKEIPMLLSDDFSNVSGGKLTKSN